MSLEEKFKAAKEKLLTLTEKPSNEIMLQLYSLYKQASKGDIEMEAPGMFDFVAKAKYNAWERLKGMDQSEAMQSYIELVSKLTLGKEQSPE